MGNQDDNWSELLKRIRAFMVLSATIASTTAQEMMSAQTPKLPTVQPFPVTHNEVKSYSFNQIAAIVKDFERAYSKEKVEGINFVYFPYIQVEGERKLYSWFSPWGKLPADPVSIHEEKGNNPKQSGKERENSPKQREDEEGIVIQKEPLSVEFVIPLNGSNGIIETVISIPEGNRFFLPAVLLLAFVQLGKIASWMVDRDRRNGFFGLYEKAFENWKREVEELLKNATYENYEKPFLGWQRISVHSENDLEPILQSIDRHLLEVTKLQIKARGIGKHGNVSEKIGEIGKKILKLNKVARSGNLDGRRDEIIELLIDLETLNAEVIDIISPGYSMKDFWEEMKGKIFLGSYFPPPRD